MTPAHAGGSDVLEVAQRESESQQPMAPSDFDMKRAVGLAVAFVAGCVILRIDTAYAARHPTNGPVFHLFWVAQLIVLIPVTMRLFDAKTRRPERLALLCAFSLFEFVPKLLRDPGGPIFHDELSHWIQSEQISRAGRPFLFNSLLTILRVFPGLHTLASALHSIADVSTWHVALVIVAVAHVLVTVAVWHLVERTTHSTRIASVGALFYAFNPGFMFFDSQFAYESLAIVFFAWGVALAMSLDHPFRLERRRMGGILVTAAVVVAACVITHHLTSYFLCIALSLMALGALLRRRANRATEPRGMLVLLACIAIASASLWLRFAASSTLDYLSPHLSGGISQVFRLIQREQSARRLFKQSPVPAYERIATFLVPALLFAFVVGAMLELRRRWRTLPGRVLGLIAFGTLYFASLPTMFTGENEGARRSWTFLYLGLTVLLAPVFVKAFDRIARRFSRLGAGAVAVILAATFLAGNVTVQANAEARFPGPYEYGSDSRSITPELTASAEWLKQEAGAGNNVVAARDNGLAFGSFGEQQVSRASAGFPVWQLYFDRGLPSKQLLDELRTSKYRYLVVDRRMAEAHPLTGVYFVDGEPAAVSDNTPPVAALNKLDDLPWLAKIYSTDNLRIYRFAFSNLNACPALEALSPSLYPGCRKPK
jgi:hypothetical protein